MFSLMSHGWPRACMSLNWETPGTRTHNGKKACWQRQGVALGNVLLGYLGYCHPCGCSLTRCTYLSPAEHLHPFMEMIFLPLAVASFSRILLSATQQKYDADAINISIN